MTKVSSQQLVERTATELVGVQVIARHWREDVVLAVMAAIEGSV